MSGAERWKMTKAGLATHSNAWTKILMGHGLFGRNDSEKLHGESGTSFVTTTRADALVCMGTLIGETRYRRAIYSDAI